MIDEKKQLEISEVIARYENDIPVKVGALAKELGLGVVVSTLQPGISGQIEPSADYPSGFIIKVNRYEVKERQRFTIAHEIGHYVLHSKQIGAGIRDTILYRSKLSSMMEVQANKFAARLLMPWPKVLEFTQNFGALNREIAKELSRRFEVSPEAMEIRLGLR